MLSIKENKQIWCISFSIKKPDQELQVKRKQNEMK